MGDRSEADGKDQLYIHAWNVRDRRTGGFWLPIIRHLALRGHTDAMIDLASWFSEDNGPTTLGKASDPFTAAGLYRRAYRRGNVRAAQHMALSCFNRRDLAGYRSWLALGARAGDADAHRQRRYFETRLWHRVAHDIKRGRPEQKRDG